MMKNNAVYILPFSSLAEKTDSELFNNLLAPDLEYFRITMFLNLIQNLFTRNEKIDIHILLNSTDKEKLNPELNTDQVNILHVDNYGRKAILENLYNVNFPLYKNNLIIGSDVIDLRPSDLDKHLNLLGFDDKTYSISKSQYGKIKIIGFNSLNEEVLKHLTESDFDLDRFLSYNKSCEYFVNVHSDILEIRNREDFKKLYYLLSNKNSYEYCSQQMHERFTHIFIEYKDLLK